MLCSGLIDRGAVRPCARRFLRDRGRAVTILIKRSARPGVPGTGLRLPSRLTGQNAVLLQPRSSDAIWGRHRNATGTSNGGSSMRSAMSYIILILVLPAATVVIGTAVADIATVECMDAVCRMRIPSSALVSP